METQSAIWPILYFKAEWQSGRRKATVAFCAGSCAYWKRENRHFAGACMDVDKQVEYWTASSAEDLGAAQMLLEKGYVRQGLFFAHLALEKILKAHVVRTRREVPPRIHNLLRLAQLAGLTYDGDREEFLRRFDAHQLEGRYPDLQQVAIHPARAREQLQKAMETAQWLKAQL